MSSSDLAIRVSGLSKAYTIRHQAEQHITLAEQVLSRVRHPFQKADRETFWALRDVDLEVKRGEVLGIIGRNGAGKSTLLKVLSRITAPTAGRVELYGRLGSLLEVGTGFHAELTGRENIYLNGTILGMKRAEIDRRFDEIVEFAGVSQFLDTPVKRYSSGMYVRLAFAVAVHMPVEVLVIDEVLAVGDADFQRRSFGEMSRVAEDGRTVILISHDLHNISRHSDRVALLKDGRLDSIDEPERTVRRYLNQRDQMSQSTRLRPGSRVTAFTLATEQYASGDAITGALSLSGLGMGNCYLSMHLSNDRGEILTQLDSRLKGFWLNLTERKSATVRFSLGGILFKPGRYFVDLFVCDAGFVLESHEAVASFAITSLPYSHSAPPDATGRGTVFADFNYELETLPSDHATPTTPESTQGRPEST